MPDDLDGLDYKATVFIITVN